MGSKAFNRRVKQYHRSQDRPDPRSSWETWAEYLSKLKREREQAQATEAPETEGDQP